MKHLRVVFMWVLISIMAPTLRAQSREAVDTPDAKIMFGLNSAEVNASFGNNAQTIELLDDILLNNEQQYKIERIEVVSSSSIDGSYNLNKTLSQNRINAVRSFLFERYPSVPRSLFAFEVLGENWVDFRACVVADPNVPYKDKVLAIIDNMTPCDEKELDLKEMYGGASWDYMKNHIFPLQRFGVGVMFVLKEEYRNEGIVTNSTSSSSSDGILLALKTNLLADVLTALNIELEVPIGNNYSVAAEFKFPWWRGENSDFTMQILSGHIEGKYWLGERTKENRLQGFSAGLFTGFGTYDIQPFTTSGVSGDFFELGALVGYSHTIYKSLNLEYGAGLAYLYSSYRSYGMSNVDNLGYVKVLKEESVDSRISKYTCFPLRFKVSLVWNFEIPTL